MAPIFLDSNILIYAHQKEEPQHEAAKALRDQGLSGDILVCISPQVLREFFSVMTNTGPRGPQTPLSSKQAAKQVKRYYESENFQTIYPGGNIVPRLLSLLEEISITGRHIHDLFLAATMLENDVTRVYTYDPTVFSRVPGIEVLTPDQPTEQPSAN